MLSIILYGRNDSYGYNLHKRAALSLNCMAEVLGSDGDEILFVDYNTPDDYPTLPEAIRDTLTGRVRRLLRIFRVRPAMHRQFQGRTHLPVLEPVARNVALRRWNPRNRRVLSTNTDMIFVPRADYSLSEVAATLGDAFYHIPRFEIPETLWESLDRMNPAATIGEIGQRGWTLHLNEVTRGSDMILCDSPGDFQLATRADVFRIDGFDERMLLGWHIDSNLARRLGFLHSRPRSLADRFFGHHCDHTRQVTPMHRHDRIQNDWRVWADDLSQAAIPEQSGHWWLAGETIEEIRLDGQGSSHASSLRAAIREPKREPTKVAYREESYDKVGYDPRHVVPFLIDGISCYPRTTRIGWIGIDPGLLERFAAAREQIGFTGRILVPLRAAWLAPLRNHCCRLVALTNLANEADGFVIDFGPRSADDEVGPGATEHTRALQQVELRFRRLVTVERRRLEGKTKAPRRFTVVNAVHGQFESLVRAHIGAATAPIATRLRQGFVLPAEKKVRSLLAVLETGSAGRRDGTSVLTLRGGKGHALYGGYVDLKEGSYRVRLICEAAHLRTSIYKTDVMIHEVVSGSHYLAFRPVQGRELTRGEVVLDFNVTEQLLLHLPSSRIEVRLLTLGLAEVRITDVTLEEVDPVPLASHTAAVDWLPLMFVGSAGELPRRWRWSRPAPNARSPEAMLRAAATRVAARLGKEGFVVFGPYASLLPGQHVLELELAPRSDQGARTKIDAGQIRLEVYSLVDNCVPAEAPLSARELPAARERLEFTVPDRLDGEGNPMQLEFRVWSSGKSGFWVRSVRTSPLSLLPTGEGEPEPRAAEVAETAQSASRSDTAGTPPSSVPCNK